jgi:hypothetical protein
MPESGITLEFPAEKTNRFVFEAVTEKITSDDPGM